MVNNTTNAAAERLTYSVAETAQILGISRKTAYALAKTDGFPSLQISPGRIVVSRPGLEKWLQQQLDRKR